MIQGDVTSRRRTVRQTVWITLAALALYVGVRSLPMDRGDLHYTDFSAGQGGPLEFCAPGGAQFVPVDRVRSPVAMSVRSVGGEALRAGVQAQLVLTLTTASGKPVTEADLLVVHTQKLHLLLVDPSLDDYQHLHPEPTSVPGEYSVDFTPQRSGEYRAFADFTPRATGRALYAGGRLMVEGSGRGNEAGIANSPIESTLASSLQSPASGLQPVPAARPEASPYPGPQGGNASMEVVDSEDAVFSERGRQASSEASGLGQATAVDETRSSVVEGYRFELGLTPRNPRINETAELSLTVLSPHGTPAMLEEIMGAHAHVVAFDQGRTGFAHLHPLAGPEGIGDPGAPLRFQLNLPDPGTYRLWAQVKVGGRELFAPFTIGVVP